MAGPFWNRLLPDEYYNSIYHIDLHSLRARGITGLVLDLDNTLAAWRFGDPQPELAEWINKVKSLGFRPFIVSNDLGPRVELFTRFLSIPGRARAGKPRPGAFREALTHLAVRPDEAAVVGDQIFTDILGAKRLGCHTILVVPISQREFFGTRLVRRVERWLLNWFIRRGRLTPPLGREGE